MTTENLAASFPETRQDLTNLKQTAVDAARDLGSTASVHAKKAQSHLQDLASHARNEGGEQLDQVKVGLADLGSQARDYIVARPFATIGIALAIGFLFGMARRGRSRAD